MASLKLRSLSARLLSTARASPPLEPRTACRLGVPEEPEQPSDSPPQQKAAVAAALAAEGKLAWSSDLATESEEAVRSERGRIRRPAG